MIEPQENIESLLCEIKERQIALREEADPTIKYLKLERLAIDTINVLQYELEPSQQHDIIEYLKDYANTMKTLKLFLPDLPNWANVLEWPINKLTKGLSARAENAIRKYLDTEKSLEPESARVKDILILPNQMTDFHSSPIKPNLDTRIRYLRGVGHKTFSEIYNSLVQLGTIERYPKRLEYQLTTYCRLKHQ